MRLSVRLGLLLFVVLTLSVAAEAQEGGCYVCKQFTDHDGETYQWCGYPSNNDWGYDRCGLSSGTMFVSCRNWGFRCYYFEVY